MSDHVANQYILAFNCCHLHKDVICNSVFNGKKQFIEGYKQKWPISFYSKALTVSLIGRRIDICVNIALLNINDLISKQSNELESNGLKSIFDDLVC